MADMRQLRFHLISRGLELYVQEADTPTLREPKMGEKFEKLIASFPTREMAEERARTMSANGYNKLVEKPS